MSYTRRQLLLVISIALLLAACQPARSKPLPPLTVTTAAPEPTPVPALEPLLRESFRDPDPLTRRQSVLAATDAFLRSEAIRRADDSVAATYYTDIAFSSGRLTLPQPVTINRHEATTIIALPEGMGLYLFDLNEMPDSPPLELSRWTVGLAGLEVSWGTEEVAVSYTTNGRDGQPRPHYVLAVRGDSGWRRAWFSDEQPEWWFNAVGGSMQVEPDRHGLTLSGTAELTTEAFYEQSGEPQRTFSIYWERQGSSFQPTPERRRFPDRAAWLRAAADPSPYASLVAFFELLQARDTRAAAEWTSTLAVLDTARSFGLDNPSRRYQARILSETEIQLRDVQGTFVVTFIPPAQEADQWLIDSIAPPGAPPVTPTSTPTAPLTPTPGGE